MAHTTKAAGRRRWLSSGHPHLGVEHVGPSDDFFALGGHSLLAIRVVARLKTGMKLAVPITVIFEHPQLRNLADYVEHTIRARLGEGAAR